MERFWIVVRDWDVSNYAVDFLSDRTSRTNPVFQPSPSFARAIEREILRSFFFHARPRRDTSEYSRLERLGRKKHRLRRSFLITPPRKLYIYICRRSCLVNSLEDEMELNVRFLEY